VDSYRSLFLPAILVGDSRLGGISSTISAYESLLLRGYIVDVIVMFRNEYYRNSDYLASYFAERGVRVMAVDPPPPPLPDHGENFSSTDSYYDRITSQAPKGDIVGVLNHLDGCHASRINELDTMPRRTLDAIWWPFVQHGLVSKEEEVMVIDSAHSDFFSVYNNKDSGSSNIKQSQSLLEPTFDGSASWWTQALGHAHPTLALAAARAAGRYGHVMFAQATHLPALKLAERLLHNGPGKGWASRVFFSDDGSTGMEIALKMALRAFSVRNGERCGASTSKNLGIVGLKGSYHGDTIGAMDACEEGVYTCEWHNAKGFWFDPPTVSIRKGKVVISLPPSIAAEEVSHDIDASQNSLAWAYNIPQRLETPLATVYREYIQHTLQALRDKGGLRLAALVLEPLVMGSGGMIFVDPLFQRIMIDVVRGVDPSPSQWSGLPVIFDEVFVGLYRMGMQSTAPLLGVDPDISVHAKILTGGVVPLAVTLASDSIFQAFLGERKSDAFLHGHSYTAHAVGCEIANETLDILAKLVDSDSWKLSQSEWAKQWPESTPSTVWSFWNPTFVYLLSNVAIVEEAMTLGTVLAIRFKDSKAGQLSQL
jgi:dethiobiotin synthetase/adenosylmethionine--8-amino-7-oxononanoate aminotransferase